MACQIIAPPLPTGGGSDSDWVRPVLVAHTQALASVRSCHNSNSGSTCTSSPLQCGLRGTCTWLLALSLLFSRHVFVLSCLVFVYNWRLNLYDFLSPKAPYGAIAGEGLTSVNTSPINGLRTGDGVCLCTCLGVACQIITPPLPSLPEVVQILEPRGCHSPPISGKIKSVATLTQSLWELATPLPPTPTLF